MGQGNSGTPVTECPNCNVECEEIFYKPERLGKEWTLKDRGDGHKTAWKSNPDGGFTINPYPQGGTFLICKKCGLHTFYPRGENNVQ